MDGFMNSPMEMGENEKVTEISGSIEHVIYYNEENGYAVCDLGTDNDDLITITGIMPYISEGDSIKVYGEWKHNAKYGRQFAVSQYERFLPANATAILRYLSSGAIKGIGKKTAQKIVDEFGDDTLEVLENHPDWLSDIPGISLKKAKAICEDFKEKAGIRTAMLFFREYFGAAITVRIYKRWGAAAVDIARADPYRICDEIEGVGFSRADQMAMKLGVPKQAPSRIASGIIYLLSDEAAQNGHVCLPMEMLVRTSAELLEVEPDAVRQTIGELLDTGRLRSYEADDLYVFDRRAYKSERYIAEKLILLDKVCPAVPTSDVRVLIANEERRCGLKFAELQKEAIELSLESGIMLLTGGPGTGKTTIVKALLEIFSNMGMKVALAAPTGRAAKRLSEATSHEAKTIHRLLEYDFSSGEDGRVGFRRNETDLLDEHVIIVDEASMIDNFLMSSLLKAVKPGARMILIGDADQLPSVGAGNVLLDLIESDRFSTVRLDEIFRQAQKSLIVTNAHRINKGKAPILDVKDNDFFFLSRQSDRDIALTVTDLCKNRLPKSYGKQILSSLQVISPSRRGEAGTDNLNRLLQEALNPAGDGKREYKFRDTVFREGDRVMQTKNNYDIEWCREDDNTGMGIFNGDVGRIVSIDTQNSFMEIVFDDRHVSYDFSMLEELEHAYAVTVHKSQGSEYGTVIIPLYAAPPLLLNRNLFYTAVTRAQNRVILVGREDIAEKMVYSVRMAERYTCLCHRLMHGGGM